MTNEDNFEVHEEYDLTGAVSNPYVQQFQELNLVSLDNDVAKVLSKLPIRQ